MVPSATVPPAPLSALDTLLSSNSSTQKVSPHPPHLHNLALTILHDLQYQHYWTSLSIHTHSSLTSLPLSRPIISGLPPKRAYTHPDEQAAILKAEHERGGERIEQLPEREWVLPTHLQEKMSLRRFKDVFDALSTVPPTEEDGSGDWEGGEGKDDGEEEVGWQWRGEKRQKRVLLATLNGDSTVVYYIMHDGLVKPRQN